MESTNWFRIKIGKSNQCNREGDEIIYTQIFHIKVERALTVTCQRISTLDPSLLGGLKDKDPKQDRTVMRFWTWWRPSRPQRESFLDREDNTFLREREKEKRKWDRSEEYYIPVRKLLLKGNNICYKEKLNGQYSLSSNL